MSALPEDITPEVLAAHRGGVAAAGNLIDLTVSFMRHEADSPEERIAEVELASGVMSTVDLPEEVVANVIMSLCALIVEVAEPGPVVAWFERQYDRLNEAEGSADAS